MVNPFSVSTQSNGKKRLIADLQHLNLYLDPPKFKMEDLKAALPSLKQNNFMFQFDITKGYYHMDIHPDMQKYFGFCFEHGGQKYYGYYTVIPFGVSSGPLLFTKLLRLLIKHWRQAGIHIYMFINDGLGMAKTLAEGRVFASMVRSDLACLGLIEQVEKSIREPAVRMKWLGTIIDLCKKLLIVPQAKREQTMEVLKSCLRRKKVSARELCKAAGLINSLAMVIGNKVVIQTKQFYLESNAHVQTKFHWDNKFRMSMATKNTVQFWIRELKSESFERSFVSAELETVAYSDASGVAGVAYVDAIENESWMASQSELVAPQDMHAQNWSEEEKQCSSTCREVKTIEQGLLAFKHRLAALR